MTTPVLFSDRKQFFDASQQQRLADRRRVTLYFVGYSMVGKDGRLPTFPVKGRAIQAPPVGESLELDSVVAADLMSRSQLYDPQIGFVQVFTEDPNIAKAVKAALESGAVSYGDSPKDARKLFENVKLNQIDDAALEAEINRRRATKSKKE